MKKKIQMIREVEQKTMASYVLDGCIDFEKLPVIEGHVRSTLLKWLGKGIANSDKKGKTEDGRLFQVEIPEDQRRRCLLRCDDGNLDMPAYVIRFLDQKQEVQDERA